MCNTLYLTRLKPYITFVQTFASRCQDDKSKKSFESVSHGGDHVTVCKIIKVTS